MSAVFLLRSLQQIENAHSSLLFGVLVLNEALHILAVPLIWTNRCKQITMLRNILYSFPVQLLVNHFKENKTLLFFWFILVGAITGNLGGFLGLRHLLLAPEYLDQSGFWSFFIMGVAMGGFTMVFHSTTCIIDIHKFPFVGALSRPFAKFCLNNSIIPLACLVTYVVSIVHFQRVDQQSTPMAVVSKVLGLLMGFTLIALLMFTYMVVTNKDIFAYRAQSMTRRFRQALLYRINLIRKLAAAEKNTFQIISYFDTPYRIGYTKNLDKYYDPFVVVQIFNQNRLNLIFFELIAVALLFALGFFGHHAFSQIPAAASGILFLAILMMLTGFLTFWTRGWASTTIIIFVVILNMLTECGLTFGAKESHAFGLSYESSKADYSLAEVRQVNSRENYLKDKRTTLQILDNWRRKFPATKAPKLVIVCASGGGQKAALWVMKVLQIADSSTNGKLMEHTMLMSCVSGGALGASYFRELCLRKKLGEAIDPYDKKHLDKIAHNTLNPIVFNLVTNDILLDINKFQYQGMTYRRDRGYALEEQVNKCTDFILEKPLKAYREPEFKSTIPMLLLTPTIVNDGRKLFISPHNVSYMGTDYCTEGASTEANGKKVKGIDFIRFFRDQGADNLRFLSALRMTATYPYVLPSVTLPSTPTMEVMDAALFDNFGVTDAVRFLYVFRAWISKNTSGVVLVTIRGSIKEKEQEIDQGAPKSLFQKLTNPIGNLQAAWINMQDIRNDDLIELADVCLENDIATIEFQYTPARQEQRKYSQFKTASLSWHLTAEEKSDIWQAIQGGDNQQALENLKDLLD
jgi:hypothetical protein